MDTTGKSEALCPQFLPATEKAKIGGIRIWLDRTFVIKVFWILAILQFLDLLTTFIAIQYANAYETNPYLLNASLPKILVFGLFIKATALFGLAIIFTIKAKKGFADKAIKAGYISIYLLLFYYTYIVLHNIRVIHNGLV